MSLKPVVAGMALVAAGIAAALVLAGGDDDPEAEIRAALDRAVAAAEARDLGRLMELVSERYQGAGGTRDDVRRTLFVVLRQDSWRRVFLVDTAIEIGDSAEDAKVTTKAVLAGGDEVKSIEDLTPAARASLYRFELEMQREDADWRVRKAEYRRADARELIPGH